MLTVKNVVVPPSHNRQDGINDYFQNILIRIGGHDGLRQKLKCWGVNSRNEADYQGELRILTHTSLCIRQAVSLSHLLSLMRSPEKIKQLTDEQLFFLLKRALDGIYQADCGERLSVFDPYDELAEKHDSYETFTGCSVDDLIRPSMRTRKYNERVGDISKESKKSRKALKCIMRDCIAPFVDLVMEEVKKMIRDYNSRNKEVWEDIDNKNNFFNGRNGTMVKLSPNNLRELLDDPLCLYIPTLPIFDSDDKWFKLIKLYHGNNSVTSGFEDPLKELCGTPKFVAGVRRNQSRQEAMELVKEGRQNIVNVNIRCALRNASLNSRKNAKSQVVTLTKRVKQVQAKKDAEKDDQLVYDPYSRKHVAKLKKPSDVLKTCGKRPSNASNGKRKAVIPHDETSNGQISKKIDVGDGLQARKKVRIDKTASTVNHYPTQKVVCLQEVYCNGGWNGILDALYPDLKSRRGSDLNDSLESLNKKTLTVTFGDVKKGLESVHHNELEIHTSEYQALTDSLCFLVVVHLGMNAHPHCNDLCYCPLSRHNSEFNKSIGWKKPECPIVKKMTPNMLMNHLQDCHKQVDNGLFVAFIRTYLKICYKDFISKGMFMVISH